MKTMFESNCIRIESLIAQIVLTLSYVWSNVDQKLIPVDELSKRYAQKNIIVYLNLRLVNRSRNQ